MTIELRLAERYEVRLIEKPCEFRGLAMGLLDESKRSLPTSRQIAYGASHQPSEADGVSSLLEHIPRTFPDDGGSLAHCHLKC